MLVSSSLSLFLSLSISLYSFILVLGGVAATILSPSLIYFYPSSASLLSPSILLGIGSVTGVGMSEVVEPTTLI